MKVSREQREISSSQSELPSIDAHSIDIKAEVEDKFGYYIAI